MFSPRRPAPADADVDDPPPKRARLSRQRSQTWSPSRDASPPAAPDEVEDAAALAAADAAAADSDSEGEHCTICLQDFRDRTVLPLCAHEFCFECILLWAGAHLFLSASHPYPLTRRAGQSRAGNARCVRVRSARTLCTASARATISSVSSSRRSARPRPPPGRFCRSQPASRLGPCARAQSASATAASANAQNKPRSWTRSRGRLIAVGGCMLTVYMRRCRLSRARASHADDVLHSTLPRIRTRATERARRHLSSRQTPRSRNGRPCGSGASCASGRRSTSRFAPSLLHVLPYSV
jgi:hypothetical protein